MASHTILTTPLLSLLLIACQTVNFNIVNRCSYTVWAASYPNGGQQLDPGASWSFHVAAGTPVTRIWARTGCTFDSNGNGRCQTGDCGGVLACTGQYGSRPNTVLEYQPGSLDYLDLSLVEGFNVPLSLSPTSSKGCSSSGLSCPADITSQCPSQLKTPGGCNDPCTVFKTPKYCCPRSCKPTSYSQFFKNLCPDAFSYPRDNQNGMLTCPRNSNYQVVFCP